MNTALRHRLTLSLAVTMTGAGLVMAAAAALERAGTPLDKLLLTVTAVGLALGAHMLPALAQRRAVLWLLWLGCLVATLYGHAHFFSAASQRAGEQRAAQVVNTQVSAALQAQLAGLPTRSAATVASDLAQVTARVAQAEVALARCLHNTPQGCAGSTASIAGLRAKLVALQEELTQARQASQLRDRLTAAAQQEENARAGAATDPIDLALASLTGLPPTHVGLGAVAMQALLLELLAATLWALALSSPQEAGQAMSDQRIPTRTHGLSNTTSPAQRRGRWVETVRDWVEQCRLRWSQRTWPLKSLPAIGAKSPPQPATTPYTAAAPMPQVRDGPGPTGRPVLRNAKLRQPLRKTPISSSIS